MNRTPHPALAIRISTVAAFAALVSLQIIACSDDTPSSSGNPEAGTGGEAGSGGTGAGGKPSSGGASGGTAGSAGTAGAGGGVSGAGGKEAGAPETGSPGGAGGGVPEASTPDASEPDAAPDGPPPPPPCGAPADPNKAKLCLAFDPEVVKLETDPALDGNGTLYVDIFDKQPASPTETPFMAFVYPPGVTDGGLEETGIYSLSEFSFDGLPETVYVRTIFADNPLYTNPAVKIPVTFGAFVGGFDLTQGVVDLSTGNPMPPPVRAVTLKKGEGTRVTQLLHAMRKFSTKVSLDVPQASIADDAQGIISVGAFDVSAPASQPVLGGTRTGCVDLLTASPLDVAGFVYGTGDFWLGGQLDDFNRSGLSKPGDIVSLGEGANGQSIPAAQKFTITDQYSVSIPKLSLNTVLPGSTGFTPYPCQ